MFQNIINKKWLIATLVILVILNFLAFYFIQQSLGTSDALEHAENQQAINHLQRKQLFSDVFPSIIFTLDIFSILFLVYLLLKFIFRTIKKSIPNK